MDRVSRLSGVELSRSWIPVISMALIVLTSLVTRPALTKPLLSLVDIDRCDECSVCDGL